VLEIFPDKQLPPLPNEQNLTEVLQYFFIKYKRTGKATTWQ